MKKTKALLILVFLMSVTPGFFNVLKAQYFVQDFENVAGITNWVIQNNSLPLGPTTWEQGIITEFEAYSGAGYIRANFGSTNDPTNNGRISNWLISPPVTFQNGDIISFYTRKTDSGTMNYPDRLQLRLSLAGTSTNVGVTSNGVGDFTILLKDINSGYSNAGFPTGYPYQWKRFDASINGLSAPTQGRFAFRYFVESAGNTGNSDYIGLDSVAFHMPVVGIGEIDPPITFGVYPNPAKDVLYVESNANAQMALITDLLGNVVGELSLYKGKGELNITGYTAGLYFVTMHTNKGKLSRKISIIN